MPLSDIQCRSAKPREKDYKLADGGRLYLLVRPTGSKLWRMNYVFADRQKTLSIGVYPTTTLAMARIARDDAKEKLRQGIDPGTLEAVAEENKFRSVAKVWFKANEPQWVTTYSSKIWARLEGDAFPIIGDKDVRAIEPTEVLSMLRSIEDRGSLEMAKRVRQMVSSVFRFAIAEGKTKIDPASTLADAMQARPRQKHRAALREEELPAFFTRLHEGSDERQTRLAIELVVHTFVRTQEVRFSTWDEIDFRRKLWRIPEEHMKMRKEHLVPLSDHAVALLEQLKTYSRGTPWIVPGVTDKKPISENTMLYCLYRLGYHSRATIHGFRSTASTILNECGLWRPDAIERQLAHVDEDEVRSAYNAALYLEERTRMMDWYSALLLRKASEKQVSRDELLEGLL